MTDIRLERPFFKQVRVGDVLVPMLDRDARITVQRQADTGILGIPLDDHFEPLHVDGEGRIFGYTRVPLEEY